MQQTSLFEALQAYVEVFEDLATTLFTDERILESVKTKTEETLIKYEKDQVNNSEPSPCIQETVDGAKL